MKRTDVYLNQLVETGMISQKENFPPSLDNVFQYLRVNDAQEYYCLVLQRFLNEQNLASTKDVPDTSLITNYSFFPF